MNDECRDKNLTAGATYCLYMAGSTKTCITMGVVISVAAVGMFILLAVNGPFFEALGQGIYNCIRLTSYMTFANSLLHHQVFSLSYIKSSPTSQTIWTFTKFTNILILMPSVAGIYSVFHPFYDLLFGRTGITRKQENASGNLEKKAQELLINTTKSNFGNTKSLFVNISTYLAVIFAGCRHQIVPASYNYLLMGPNRIKSIRCADSLNRMQWVTFVFKLFSRAWIFTYIENIPFNGYFYILDIIGHLIHNVLSTMARHQGLAASETQSIYSIMSDVYRFCEDANIDALAENELEEINENLINTCFLQRGCRNTFVKYD